MADTKKHIRERSCISCGAKASKLGLMRLVRNADGSVSFDPTGKVSGRGAYVCSSACLEQAVPARLERALKTKISAENATSLLGAVSVFEAQ